MFTSVLPPFKASTIAPNLPKRKFINFFPHSLLLKYPNTFDYSNKQQIHKNSLKIPSNKPAIHPSEWVFTIFSSFLFFLSFLKLLEFSKFSTDEKFEFCWSVRLLQKQKPIQWKEMPFYPRVSQSIQIVEQFSLAVKSAKFSSYFCEAGVFN